MDIGDLKAKVKLDYSGFDRGVKKITGGFKSLYRNAINLNQSVELVKNGYRGMEAMAKATVGSLLEAANTAESYRLRLNAMLGSQQEGTRMFKDMAKFAGQVPYEYEKIMGAATTLSGVMKNGVDEVNQWMPLITDLAAASGLSIEETTGQIVRMYSAGAGAADLFRERGITAMLGFKAGVSYTAEETKKILMEAYESPTSKFRSLTKEMAKTWDGQVSMMKDKWFLFRNEIMDSGPFAVMKAMLGEVNSAIDDMVDDGKLTQYAEDFGEAFLDASEAAIGGVGMLAKVFVGVGIAVKSLKIMWQQVSLFMQNSIGDLAGLLADYYEKINVFGIDIVAAQVDNLRSLQGDQKLIAAQIRKDIEESQTNAGKLLNTYDKLGDGIDAVKEKFKKAREEAAKQQSGEGDDGKAKPALAPGIAEDAKKVESLREKLKGMKADAVFSAKTMGFSGAPLALANIKKQYEEIIAQAPGLKTLADEWRAVAEANVVNDAKLEQDKAFLDAKEEMANMLKDARFEQSTLGMTDLQTELAQIRQQYDQIVKKNPALTEMANQWLEVKEAIAKAKDEMKGAASVSGMVTDAIDGAFQNMNSSLSDSLAEFAQTGKLHFGDLIDSLIKDLQIVAAHKTARLLMEAAFEGVMALVDMDNAAKHAAAASAALQGAAIMGSFVAGSGLAGMAHDGISSVPEDGTWLLKKGERVINDKDNAALTEYLKNGGGGMNINMPVTIQNSDEDGVKKALPALKQTIIDVVTGNIAGNGEIRKTIKGYT